MEYYTNNYSQAPEIVNKIIVKVVTTTVVISKVGDEKDFFVELTNNANSDIDISNWFLKSNGKTFVLPKNSIILSKKQMTISGKITNFNLNDKYGLKLFSGSNELIYDYNFSNQKKVFQANENLNMHLHGSLRWGYPSSPFDRFKIYEFDTADDGVKASKSVHSRDYSQAGIGRPPRTIITGLEKPESLLRQPFYAILNAFGWAMNDCTDLVIAGYGFSDKHVNMAISQCRINRPDVRTYVINYGSQYPSDYLVPNTAPYNTLLPGHDDAPVKGFPGWWKVDGASITHLKTSPFFLWLDGFDTFCQAIVSHGLPR